MDIKYKIIPKKKSLILILLLLIILNILLFLKYKIIYINNNLELEIYNSNYNNNINLNYENNSFAVIRRIDCPCCGLFSYFIVYLGCVNKFIRFGYIPIIDLESFPNIYNKMNANISSLNPWENFFNQPLGYTLENVKKRAKRINYFKCSHKNYRPSYKVFYNIILMNFWHNIAKIYIPIKSEILIEANNIKKLLFKGSKNILGILVRGTDYLALRPKGHPIPPKPTIVIKDIKEFDKNNNYDFYFISTEDDILREIFIKEFYYKIKYLVYNTKIKYNKKQLLGYNEKILGNIKYAKIYLLNIIILSKCIDLISAKTSGTIGIFILSNGFRHKKVYELGNY